MAMTLCPYCGLLLTYHHPAPGVPGAPQQPLAGCLSGCAECGAISIWENTVVGFNLRRLTPDEAAQLHASDEYRVFAEQLRAARFPRRGDGAA